MIQEAECVFFGFGGGYFYINHNDLFISTIRFLHVNFFFKH